jgi:hypothetical protein
MAVRAMRLDKPKIFGSFKDAVTYVHGKAYAPTTLAS